jgi:hypothetical protein
MLDSEFLCHLRQQIQTHRLWVGQPGERWETVGKDEWL